MISTFQLIGPTASAANDARSDETLITLAAKGQPTASIWQTGQGLVVPRTYLRSPNFESVALGFKQAGWPISVRHSGGGVVPQGPGIINLSLAYAVDGKPLDHADAAYLLICDIIALALQEYGVSTRAQAVEASFCDGRYNLATGPVNDPRKVVGTAQVWRRHPRPDGEGHLQVVLVHAIVLAAVDIDAVTYQANLLELSLGNNKQYLPSRAVSLHQCGKHGLDADAFTAALTASLQHRVAAAFPVAATRA